MRLLATRNLLDQAIPCDVSDAAVASRVRSHKQFRGAQIRGDGESGPRGRWMHPGPRRPSGDFTQTCKKIAHSGGLFLYSGGEDGNRTRLNGFAGRCITSLLPRLRYCFPCGRGKKRKPGFPFKFWSGRRVSNSRPQPWQGCALPTELLPHWSLTFYYYLQPQKTGAGEESRTLDLNLGKVALYQLSYSRICKTTIIAETVLLSKDNLTTHTPNFWSGRRVSNSRPQPWQGCALPTELLPRYTRVVTTGRHYR